jgi:hypothetical protein
MFAIIVSRAPRALLGAAAAAALALVANSAADATGIAQTGGEQSLLARDDAGAFHNPVGYATVLAADGDVIAVGSPMERFQVSTTVAEDRGVVHVFERSGGAYRHHTRLSNRTVNVVVGGGAQNVFVRFGDAVAVDGDRIAIGAPLDDGPCPRANPFVICTTPGTVAVGSVFVYRRDSSGWTLETTLRPPSVGVTPDPRAGDRFGAAVSLSGDLLLVGAPRANVPATSASNPEAGRAFLYRRSGTSWTQVRTIDNPVPIADTISTTIGFGYSVAIDGNRLLIGNPGEDVVSGGATATDAGRVYGYELGAGDTPTLLGSSSGNAVNQRIGIAVASEGQLAAVAGGDAAGAFVRTISMAPLLGFQLIRRIDLGSSPASGNLSMALDIRQGRLLVGANDNGNTIRRADLIDNGFSSISLPTLRSIPRRTNPGGSYAENDFFGVTAAFDGRGAPVIGSRTQDSIAKGALFLSGEVRVYGRRSENLGIRAAAMRRGPDNNRVVDAAADVLVIGRPGTLAGAIGSIDILIKSNNVFGPIGTPPRYVPAMTNLRPPDSAAGDGFGAAVKITSDGSTIAVGAPGIRGGRGAVYLFGRSARTSWQLRERLLHPQDPVGSGFGISVSIDAPGTQLVVGAPSDAGGLGRAYGFRIALAKSSVAADDGIKALADQVTVLRPAATLAKGGGDVGDKFGAAVAAMGNTVLVGSPGDDTSTGSVEVFTDNGAGLQATGITLTGSTPQPGDGFGTAIAIDGGTTVIGEPGDDPGGAADAGSVSVYENSPEGVPQPATQQTLTTTDGAAGDKWGSAVAISGGTVAAGAPGDDVPLDGTAPQAFDIDQGSITLFANPAIGGGTPWIEDQTLIEGDGNAFDEFGTSVAISGENVIGTAPFGEVQPTAPTDEGAIIPFQVPEVADEIGEDFFRSGFEGL